MTKTNQKETQYPYKMNVLSLLGILLLGFGIGWLASVFALGYSTIPPDSATLNATFINGTIAGYQYATYEIMQTGIISTVYQNQTYYFKILNITEITQGQAIDIVNQMNQRRTQE